MIPLPSRWTRRSSSRQAGDLVPVALRTLARGGTVAIAGIYLSQIPALDYPDLFQERQVRSVTANTRGDATEFLRLAGRLGLRVEISPYPFERADQALADLAADRFTGAAVLTISPAGRVTWRRSAGRARPRRRACPPGPCGCSSPG